ncbi:LysR family transcriptional regulator [Mycolicibacterium komossense]|uniref:LysR family transcriptional regulator n=1 Tax=Mycolicibacterium komossense TaxID=1779 RepID=A0ABT3CJ30_9MYCO|nr:LysR family transcriptional regulator [Mycolicibacterium komossense]MCV7229362.1 LysR family transcriptional regulator [Mycolicibacterium komossense]
MSDLDLRLLRYFVGLAEARSFTDAARVLHVAQPTLSQGIERLERVVGTTLVDRGPRGSTRSVALTEAGQVLLPAATDILQRIERALQSTRNVAREAPLAIGFGSSTPRDVTSRLLATCDRLAVALSLRHVPWGAELDALRNGSLDLCFLQVPENFTDPQLRVVTLRRVSRVAVFSRDHPLAGRDRLELAELDAEPIIDAASDRDFWIVNPRPSRREPHTVGPPATTVEEMLAFVTAGRGMAITSLSVAQAHGGAELSFVPIIDLDDVVLVIAGNAQDRRLAVTALLAALDAAEVVK